MGFSNRGRVALVTGGSRGIGRSICLTLAAAGYSVVVNYATSQNAAMEVVSQIQSQGGSAVAIQADISEAQQRQQLVEQVLSTFERIDLLVNNAGVAPKQRTDILDADEESFDLVMSTNLKGPYFLTQAIAKEMIALTQRDPEARPMIINIGSISAETASITRGEYCISKAGIAMMTKLYAVRLAEYGIPVYEVRPGVIATDMTAPVKETYNRLFEEGLTPLKRWGKPEDVAQAVAAIAEGNFPYSTGEVFNVDGGFHIKRL